MYRWISAAPVLTLVLLLHHPPTSQAQTSAATSGTEAARRPGLVHQLREQGREPTEYVLVKFREHDVVVLGENHWNRHDVELVLELIPRLRDAEVHLLATELLPGWEQAAVARVTTEGDVFDRTAAMDIMRSFSWPYEEYLQVLHAVWKVNHALPAGERPLRLLAIAPRFEARDSLLAEGLNFDTYMAERLLEGLRESGGRALVYTGAHHAFTRFLQPERPRRGEDRVLRFIERMGNVLWRRLGERVFRIELHRPWRCRRADGSWKRCLPVAAAIDCAAVRVGRPVGFDVVGGRMDGLRLHRSAYYAMGHPAPRLVDLTDGYVWTRPVEEYRAVTLIPLAEYAPDTAALQEASENNPFVDRIVPVEALPDQWEREAERMADFLTYRGWEELGDWRSACQQ